MSAPVKDEGVELPPIVNLRDQANVRHWCRLWGVSEAELAAAVRKAGGVEATAVAFALGKPGHFA